MYDHNKTKALLTEEKEKARCVCTWCGRMYAKRPFLCLCKSNAFLQDIPNKEKQRE